MITDDPAHAAARGDLPFLRHRALRTPAPRPAPVIDTSHHEPSRRTRSRAAATPIDTAHHDRPTASDTRSAAATRTTPVTPPTAPIDTRHRTTTAPHAAASLDLDDTASRAPSRAPQRPVTPPAPARRARRVAAGERVGLGDTTPSLTLTRVQSGIDGLLVAAFGTGVARGVRLGTLYELRSGDAGTVETATNRFAPSSRRPVIVAGTDGGGAEEHDQFGIDLRQIRDLRRFAAYLLSEGHPGDATSTMLVTTAGGSRIDLVADVPPEGRVGVVLTGYQVDGELVLRAERAASVADVREAAQAFGFGSISWRDGRTPLR